MSRTWLVRIALLVVVVILLGVALLAARLLIQPETVVLTQINRDIAFMSNRDNGQWGLYIIDPNGDIRRLTPLYEGDSTGECTETMRGQAHCAFDYFPSYAFDGEMLNFLSNRHETEMGPAQVRPDGSDFVVLDVFSAIRSVAGSQRFDWDPQWSAEGRRGWSKITDLNLEIYVSDATDTTELRITRDGFNGARDWFLSWSPDGQSFTFNTDREGTEDIYRVDLVDLEGATGPDDVTPTRLTDNPVDDIRTAWSLTGDKILFIKDDNDGLMDGLVQLWVMNPDGTEQRALAADEVFEGGAAYSADSTQMVYMSNASGTWSLYLRDVATGETVQLTDDTGDEMFPVWGPVPASGETESIETTDNE